MFSNRTIRFGRWLGALSLAAACAVPALAQVPALPRPTVMIFPFQRPESVDPSVTDVVQASLRSRLENSPRYDAMTFNTRSALVQRAVQSGSITRDQVNGPYDVATGAAIAKAAGLDYAVVGNIEEASVDAATKTATVTVTGQLVTAAGQPVATSGATGTDNTSGMATDAILRRAADAAAEKLANQLFAAPATPATPAVTAPATPPTTAGPATTGPTTAGPTTTPTALPTGTIPVEKKRKGGRTNGLLILGGVALLAIIAAASSSGGGGGGNGGGGSGNPPTFPF